MSNKQSQYNQAIDNLTYLVLHYPKPVQELLAKSNVFFQGKPSKAQLINEIVEQLKDGDSAFAKALETLIQRFSSQENDQFWGAIAKGAVGVLGGLFKKKKRRSSSSSGSAVQAKLAAQAAAAKRDMEMRMQRMREEQERRRREAEERRRQEEARRREEERKKAEAAQKKTNMMLMIGGGVVVLGLGAVVLIKSGRPASPYGQPPMPMPR
ncbi:MAG: hypothetical protein ABNH00_11675 [Dokdonia sp.]|jgi:Skp family chaperone for outer membrane proteins